MKKAYDFLVALKKNNNREWFQENKSRYQEARLEFEHFISILIGEVRKFDSEISFIDPKETVFRIYRDVRFSKDKSPYKTNMGSHIVKGGKNSGFAGYYFHLEPHDSFVGGGIYMPVPEILKSVRKEIYENIEEFISIINNPVFIKHYGEISGDRLVNPPKGFPVDFPFIDLLKYKSYTVIKSLSDTTVLNDQLLYEVIQSFKALQPFNRFINYAIAGE